MTDRPERVDTSEIELDAGLAALREILARHVHDAWMQLRLVEGWTYGPRRDDDRKEHPCLVPYEDLPESQKTYDREVALATLRAVVALGYQIIKL